MLHLSRCGISFPANLASDRTYSKQRLMLWLAIDPRLIVADYFIALDYSVC